MEIKIPNFFLVGAPKCGTSSLNNMLRQHPQIYMSPIKEPHFFCNDLIPPNYIRDLDKYLRLFEHVKNEKIIGESSATYLYSKNAASNIYEFNPDSKILIILRNPVNMIYSLYWQARASGIEKLKNFEDAVAKEEERLKDAKKSKITFTLYKDVGLYYQQVKRYFDYFDRNKVLVIIYEEFKEKPLQTYNSILDFLQLNNSFEPTVNKMNTSRIPRYFYLARFIKILKPKKGKDSSVLRQKVVRNLRKFNNVYKDKPPMNNITRNRLLGFYEEPNKQLESLIKIDLSIWDQ